MKIEIEKVDFFLINYFLKVLLFLGLIVRVCVDDYFDLIE